MLMWIIILSLLVIGLALIIIEIIFIPGTTVVGVLGLIFSGAGIVISYKHFGNDIGLYILLGTSVISLATLVYSFRSKSWSKFSLKTSNDGKVNEGMLDALAIGETGRTISTLRPIGKAEFNNKQLEVRTAGDYVDTNTPVKIILIQSHQIFVEPTN
jgi:membrane-bound ClpP family serine protease